MCQKNCTVFLTTIVLSGCSMGGHYVPEGPHPHISYVGALHVGPVELLHTPVTNARPVTDLTALTISAGPHIGPVQLTGGIGWQVSRMWGACDSNGYNCAMTWSNGYVLAAGATYRLNHLRADVRVLQYEGSTVNGAIIFLLGVGL